VTTRRARFRAWERPNHTTALSSPSSKNILVFRTPKSGAYPFRPVPLQGALRGRHERGTGCGGRKGGALTRRCWSGRRSRVVLTPRGRCQVGGSDIRQRRCQKILITGESTKETVKPLRAGMPGVSGKLVVTTTGEHLYPFLPTRLRVHWAPGIPHALFWKGGTFLTKPRAKTRGEIADARRHSGAMQSIEPGISRFRVWC
jgi:hypothetical protein